MPGYHIENFGCRATQADGAALERQFEECGLARASGPAQASVVVLNTCTVTAAADQDARAAIRRVQRQNPEAKIVVTGCYAQRAPEEIAALPGVNIVIGNSHKHQLAEIVCAAGVSRHPAVERSDSGLRDLEWSGFRRHNPGHSDFGFSDDFGPSDDFGWRSASSAANSDALSDGALAPEGPAFIPLGQLAKTTNSIFVSDIFAHTELLAAPVFDASNERTRPNLKVQDGCDNRCSFCVIPYVRGQSRSLPLDRIIREVNGLVDSGYREVVISGINLGRWGRDLDVRHQASDVSQNLGVRRQTLTLRKGHVADVRGPRSDARRPTPDAALVPQTLPSLIRAVLAGTSLEKLRISSVEPMDWSDELIDLVAQSPRIAKHAHVPMQSGSDDVLRRMHRKYRPWHYREKITKIRAAMPTAAIGADVMVGFPGESSAEFEETRRMIEDLPFTYLHVFTYSPRPGTPAASMRDQVPVQIARDRNRVLRDLAAEKKLAFMRSFIGKQIETITLRSQDSAGENACSAQVSPSNFTETLTDSYLKLHLKGHHEPNRWLRVRVEDVRDGVLIGTSEI